LFFLLLFVSFISFLHVGLPGIMLLSGMIAPTTTMRTVTAPGLLTFREGIGAGGRLARSRRHTINGITTEIMHRRILTRRRRARIRSGWRVARTRRVESAMLSSRNPIIVHKLGLVFILTALEKVM
jgi:hypothetical protein